MLGWREQTSGFWVRIQRSLFPWIEEELGPLTENLQRLVTLLDVLRLDEFIPHNFRVPGRPPKDRAAIARAFVAKSVLNLPTTRALIDRLLNDAPLRRLCGWEKRDKVPSESVFSRAFAIFASTALPSRVHEALVERNYADRLVGHISRDSTAIEAREKPLPSPKADAPPAPPRKRGRPKKGEERVQEPTRLERQLHMTLPQMIDDLPKPCSFGAKRNSQGFQETWIGYKLHLDVADGDVPIGAILTSASVHDSQVAIPLASLSAQRVTSLYDLMDSAYDADEIKNHSRSLGHVPIIDINPRRNTALKEELHAEKKRREFLHFKLPEELRYNQRTASERVNARLKDDFGGRNVRVRGNAKVMCHLMFGVLALTAEQILHLVI